MESRRHPRLREYDYSETGVYFITVCSKGKSHIFGTLDRQIDCDTQSVGRGLAPATVRLSKWGSIIEQQLHDIENRYPHIKIDKYVIMPNHVHIIMILNDKAAGASPRPTVSDAICAWKSLSTRQCKKEGFLGSIWQTSFHDHIIRDEHDYLVRWQYIDDNPAKWAEDEYYRP